MKKVIPFLKYRYIAISTTIGLIVLFIVLTFVIRGGFHMGIDFVGGARLVATFNKGVDEHKIRKALIKFDPTVQKYGSEERNDYSITTKLSELPSVKARASAKTEKTVPLKITDKSGDKTAASAPVPAPVIASKDAKPAAQKAGPDKKIDKAEKAEPVSDKEKERIEQEVAEIKAALNASFKDVKFISTEGVGPAIGDYLRASAMKLILFSMVLMTIYLAFRFETKFAVGAMVALIHDIALSIGFAGLLGVEISIPVIAAFLTIFGYSVNDTIIVFDRVRENMNMNTNESMIDIMNRSITETLSRTILTVLTTLFGVFAIFMIAGAGLKEFATILLLGFVIGAYSSMFIASPFVLWWEKYIQKKTR